MLTLVLLALAVWGAYWYSIWRRPYRRCPRGCRGGDNVDTTLFRGTFGRCWHCRGSGQVMRWGVRLFMPGRAAEIRSGKKGRNH